MIRLFIVDDDPLVRAGLRFIFDSAEDIKCVGEASDGKRSITEVRRVRPDVVLMDLRMPGMDGLEATAKLMALSEPPRVLALTTFDTDAHLLSVLDAGASGYLLKDTPPAELIDAVREAAKGRAILSARHTRVLLDKYSADGKNAKRNQAVEALSQLTEREREVVRYVARGLTNAEIGECMHCSPATVKAHLASIFAQLQISNRVRLAVLGHDAGLSDTST